MSDPHYNVEESHARLLNRVRHARSNFVREIKSEVIALDNDEVLVVTRLLDEHHDISLSLLVAAGLIIAEIGARMDRIPYPVCAQTMAAYQSLRGLFVFQRGIIREIRGRVERTAGCTHSTELVEASLRALFAGMYSVRRKVDLSKIIGLEELRQMNIQRPFLVDTCRAFRQADLSQEILAEADIKIRAAGYDPVRLDPLDSLDPKNSSNS